MIRRLPLLTILVAACATPKSELIDSGSFSIAEANREKSIALKKTCVPIDVRLAITDKEAVAFAIHNRVDTVQVFRSYWQRTGVFGTDLVRDLRFWKCEGRKEIRVAKKNIKSTREKARLGFLRFTNSTQDNAQNFDWLADTLPEAIDTAMQSRFVYETPDKKKLQSELDALLPSGAKDNESKYASICEKAQLDYSIAGEFYFDPPSKKLIISAIIFHNDKRSIIGQVTSKSAVDASIFGKINDIADMVVKTLAAYEAKR